MLTRISGHSVQTQKKWLGFTAGRITIKESDMPMNCRSVFLVFAVRPITLTARNATAILPKDASGIEATLYVDPAKRSTTQEASKRKIDQKSSDAAY
jgi:hypothetical protein